MGEATQFLGIRLIRNRQERKLWIYQDSYIEKIAHKFHLTPRNPPNVPLSTTYM